MASGTCVPTGHVCDLQVLRGARMYGTGSPSPMEMPGIGHPGHSRPRGAYSRRRATITGIRAACTTEVLTEPSSIPANPPRPWLPTTTN